MVIRPRSALAGAHQLLLERVAVGQDPLRPGQHPLAFRRQPLEAVAALDHQDAQIFLEMAQAGGEGRLRHAAGLGRAREMPLAGEGHEVAELADVHGRSLVARRRGAPYIPHRVRNVRRRKEISMATATMTSKGQLTVPKEIREQLGLKAGDKVEFAVDGEDGRVIMRRKSSVGIAASYFGFCPEAPFRSPPKRSTRRSAARCESGMHAAGNDRPRHQHPGPRPSRRGRSRRRARRELLVRLEEAGETVWLNHVVLYELAWVLRSTSGSRADRGPDRQRPVDAAAARCQPRLSATSRCLRPAQGHAGHRARQGRLAARHLTFDRRARGNDGVHGGVVRLRRLQSGRKAPSPAAGIPYRDTLLAVRALAALPNLR